MTAPALARGKTGRRYVWPPNTDRPELVVPSVTTILGQLAKPALTNWAAKEVATYAVEQILAWQDLPADSAIDLLKRAPYRNMTKKGDIGTAVHTAIDSWIGGEPVVENLDLLPYVGAAISFMDDQVEKVIHSEVTIFNRTYKYAGTTDSIVTLKDGRTAIVDWKSGKAIYPEVALQLAAYANGEFIGTDDGETLDPPSIDVGIVVHLPGDGNYTSREVPLTPRLWKTFQALRTVQLWKDDYEADALGKAHKGSAKTADVPATGNRKGKYVAQNADD
jgi:hypothetical protein